jgi:hypothetical protein
VDTAGVSLDTLNTLDAAIEYVKRSFEHGGTSSSTDAPVVSLCTSSDLAMLLRKAEEKAVNLRREVCAVAEAAAVELLEEGLVLSAVNELAVHVQEQQQSRIEPLPSAIDSVENKKACIICLAALESTLLLPCNHQVMCAECATEVLSSSSPPQCPVCRARVTDCIFF